MKSNLPKNVLLACIFLTSHVLFAQMKQDSVSQQQKKPLSIKSYTIHQEVDFTVSPERIYTAILDSKQFSEFTAQGGGFSATSAKIDSAEGGAFTLFDGYITGRNVELIPNQRVVQAWHDKEWPVGVYSLVKFELIPKGSGTHLVFDHTGFPPPAHDHLAQGWKDHYWDPIKKYLH